VIWLILNSDPWTALILVAKVLTRWITGKPVGW